MGGCGLDCNSPRKMQPPVGGFKVDIGYIDAEMWVATVKVDNSVDKSTETVSKPTFLNSFFNQPTVQGYPRSPKDHAFVMCEPLLFNYFASIIYCTLVMNVQRCD